MNKKYKVVHPKNLGWIEYKLNNKEMDYVWRCIENKKDNCNSSLAGNITASYDLMDRGDWFWINTLCPLINSYNESFGMNLGDRYPTRAHPYYLSRWWVNYQRQTEFNPFHSHSGIYSFVIWMKIPIDAKQQNKKAIALKSNSPRISHFEISYIDILGKIWNHQYELSKEDEGTMLLFPSALSHQVYPFYDSDEERISISGNIWIDTHKRS